MKKLILVTTIILSGCNTQLSQDQTPLVISYITSVRTTEKNYKGGRYKYGFESTNLEYWSDSLYRVGDTLKIKKENETKN